MKRWLPILLLWCGCLSCVDYTPKPKGYLRIEPGTPQYTSLQIPELPYAFNVSQLATIELSPADESPIWINIIYPELKATIYCTYLPVTTQTLAQTDYEIRSLFNRQIRQASVSEKIFDHPEAHVYAALLEVAGEAPSPIQFVVTDSVSRFFRGALYYEAYSNADSITPVTEYLRRDIIELIESFHWKN